MNTDRSQTYEKMEVAVISTAHLPEVEIQYWNTHSGMYTNDYGVIIYIPQMLQNEEQYPISFKLGKLFNELGYTWLRFDCDGDEHSHLETFDW